MGLVGQLLTRAAGHPSQHSLAAIFGMGANSYSGVSVTEDSAITYSAVFAAIRLLSWSTAMLPLLTYRRQQRGKVRAEDHPLYPLLKEQSNPEMTSFDFRSTLMAHAVGRGNGYAEIEWSNGGKPLALWPLNPAKTTPERIGGQLRYLVNLPDGTTANLPSWRVHHIRGLSSNGVIGYSPIRLAMQAIGLGLATEEFGSRFFGNGARPGLIIKHPGELSDTAFDKLKASWNADHEGLSNSHRVKILEEGMDIETVGVPPEEAQFLETRKFQITEIARWFNVPPHMIADMSGATFSNIEEQGVEFVTYSLGPWLTNSEQALSRDLLTDEEKRTILIEHLVDGLLRGRTSERFAAYQSALQGGWMSPNEVRERENLNPYDGGDTYLLPLNMAPADQAGQRGTRAAHDDDCGCRQCQGVSRETRADDDGVDDEPAELGKVRRRRQKLAADYLPLYEDVAKRVTKREVADIRRAVGKQLRRRSAAEFRLWLDAFYREFVDVLIEQFDPLMRTYAAQVVTAAADELDEEDPGVTEEILDFIAAYLAAFAAGYAAAGLNQLQAVMADAEEAGEDVGDALERRLDEWDEKKASKTALRQAYEAMNAVTVAQYRVFGVLSLIWLARGKSCPYCRGLNGKKVSINDYFVQKGQSIAGGADDEPMKVRGSKRYGPLHRGCDCTVAAG